MKMITVSEIMQDIDKGDFSKLESLALQSGFRERIDIDTIKGRNQYKEELEKKRSIKGFRGFELTGRGPALPVVDDLNDYLRLYNSGFVLRKRNGEKSDILATGLFDEKYNNILDWSAPNRYRIEIENIKPPIPFVYLAKGYYEITSEILAQNCERVARVTRDKKQFPIAGLIIGIPVCAAMGAGGGGAIGMGVGYLLEKVAGTPIDPVGILGGIIGAASFPAYILSYTVSEWVDNLSRNFKYGKYAINNLIKNGTK